MNEISLFWKVIQSLKAIFWRKSDIFYINSNKKVFDQETIDNLTSTKKCKWIINESKLNKIGLRSVKTHFARMRVQLYQITRNLQYKPLISYAGYVSTPFGIYDGFCLGDNHNYRFYDTAKNSNKTYKINFMKKRTNNYSFDFTGVLDEVSLLISSSFPINYQTIQTNSIFEYKKLISNQVTNKDLCEVFYYVSDFLDQCRNANVKKIHLYSSSRQPVSFIVGLAIQSHHPQVIAYEFEKGRYTWGINIQNSKVIRRTKDELCY